MNLSQELAQQLLAHVPEHERTSCSDSNPLNGKYSMTNGRTAPRCGRCALLEVATGKVVDALLLSFDLGYEQE